MQSWISRHRQIHVNDRICQFRIEKHQPTIGFEEVDHLNGEDRGGIGSVQENSKSELLNYYRKTLQ